jgi:hypothetical protein
MCLRKGWHISQTDNLSQQQFGAIYVINLPVRTDRRDALALMSTLNGLELEYIDGKTGNEVADKALPPPASHISQLSGNLGSWRGHLNAIRA